MVCNIPVLSKHYTHETTFCNWTRGLQLQFSGYLDLIIITVAWFVRPKYSFQQVIPLNQSQESCAKIVSGECSRSCNMMIWNQWWWGHRSNWGLYHLKASEAWGAMHCCSIRSTLFHPLLLLEPLPHCSRQKMKNENQPRQGVFRTDIPWICRSRVKTLVRALGTLENKHVGTDIHDPKAQTSTTLRHFQETLVRKTLGWTFVTQNTLTPVVHQ